MRDASAEKTLGADSTTFVEVPLDVVMQYFYRAKHQSSALPLSQRLAWLEARGLEDRSDWVAKFRESSKSLGEVIKETCGGTRWPIGYHMRCPEHSRQRRASPPQ